MRSLGDVKEYTVDEVEEHLQFEVLAPGEAQVEEELREALKLNHVRLVLLLPF